MQISPCPVHFSVGVGPLKGKLGPDLEQGAGERDKGELLFTHTMHPHCVGMFYGGWRRWWSVVQQAYVTAGGVASPNKKLEFLANLYESFCTPLFQYGNLPVLG